MDPEFVGAVFFGLTVFTKVEIDVYYGNDGALRPQVPLYDWQRPLLKLIENHLLENF